MFLFESLHICTFIEGSFLRIARKEMVSSILQYLDVSITISFCSFEIEFHKGLISTVHSFV